MNVSSGPSFVSSALQLLAHGPEAGGRRGGQAAGPLVPGEAPERKRGGLSANELDAVLQAMAPLIGNRPADEAMASVGHLAGDIAAVRATGEDVALITWGVAGGGGMGFALSGKELAAALMSDDPNSLGTITTGDGKVVFGRDLLREALVPRIDPEQAAAGLGPSAKDRIAAAVSRMMEKAAEDGTGDSPPSAGDGEDGDASVTQISITAAQEGDPWMTVTILPAQTGTAASGKAEGQLLDMQA